MKVKKFIASAVTVVAAFMLSSCVKPISVDKYRPIVDLEYLTGEEICEKRWYGDEGIPKESNAEENNADNKSTTPRNITVRTSKYNKCTSAMDEWEKRKDYYEKDLEKCRVFADLAAETYKKRYQSEAWRDIRIASFRVFTIGAIAAVAFDTKMGLAAGLLEIPGFTGFLNSAIASRNEHPRASEAYQVARNGAAQIVDKCMEKRGYPLLFDPKGQAQVRGLCTDEGQCADDDNK